MDNSSSSYNNIFPYGAGKGNVVLNGGTSLAQLDLGGTTQNINGLISSGNGAEVNVTSNPGGGTLVLGNNNATATFNGIIGTAYGSGTTNINLTKVGGGTQTLGGANNYSGATLVAGGTLSITGSLASGSAVTVSGASRQWQRRCAGRQRNHQRRGDRQQWRQPDRWSVGQRHTYLEQHLDPGQPFHGYNHPQRNRQ